MLKVILRSLVAFFLLTYAAQATPLDSLEFYTEEAAPLNFKNGDLKGITVDILSEIFKRTKSSKSKSDIKIVPWARGYNELKTNPNAVLFATAKTSEREPQFKWVGPITGLNIIVIVKKGSPPITETVQLKKLTIASVRDDVGEQLLVSEAGYPEASLERSSLENNLKKLQAGRVDAVAFMELPARYKISQMGFKQEDFVTGYNLLSLDLYYALSKNVPDATVAFMQKAMDDIRSDGTLKNIIAGYQ